MHADLSIPMNVGSLDRLIRTAAGTALVIWPIVKRSSPLTAVLSAAIGGTQIHTGIVGY